jgi:hypothetical protein
MGGKQGLKIIVSGIFMLFAFISNEAKAAEVDLYCQVAAGPPQIWAPCTASNPLQTSGGGGGGGLSVTDQAAFTAGSSSFTPGGGVFNDAATLSSGQQGTFRMTTKRAQVVDVDSTGNQLHSDLTSPIPAGTNLIGSVVSDIIVTPSANFTRPANTTQYAVGQLVANSTTAGSVTPMSWTAARINAGNFYVRRFRMTLSSKSITSTSFRLHLFTVTPATITNGDGGTFSVTEANEFCTLDTVVSSSGIINWEAGADVSIGYGTPSQGNECNGVAAGGTQTIYGLLEARATYTPASGETITVIPEIHQN